MQASLFDDIEPLVYDRPAIPDVTPWNRLKLLDEEKKLVTVYLSSHPLDPFYMEITYGCTCSCDEFEERKNIPGKYRLGGLLTSIVEKTDKTGKPYGRLTIEDFSGKTEFFIFGSEYLSIRNNIFEGAYVMVDLNVTPSKYRNDRMDIHLERFTELNQIKGKIANEVCIYLDSKFDIKDFYEKMLTFEGADRPGRITLEIFDSETKQVIRVKSRKNFSITKDLMDFLESRDINFKVK